jgi:hypothetical protein
LNDQIYIEFFANNFASLSPVFLTKTWKTCIVIIFQMCRGTKREMSMSTFVMWKHWDFNYIFSRPLDTLWPYHSFLKNGFRVLLHPSQQRWNLLCTSEGTASMSQFSGEGWRMHGFSTFKSLHTSYCFFCCCCLFV